MYFWKCHGTLVWQSHFAAVYMESVKYIPPCEKETVGGSMTDRRKDRNHDTGYWAIRIP